MKQAILNLILILLWSGCNSDLEQTVTATPKPPEIEILNGIDKSVHYFLIETETLSLVFLTDPCKNFQPNLPANSTLILPYEEILGFDEKAKSAWFSWTDCQGHSNTETIDLF